LRPKLSFDAEDVRAMLEGIEWIGETVFASPLSVKLRDPDDLPFLEVAAAARADALVTGNVRHYRPVNGRHAVRVLTPRELLDLLPKEV